MTLGRRVFVMTDLQAAEKSFQARRAGLLAQDDAADEAFLAQLLLVEPPGPRQPKNLRTARPLTEGERARYLHGQPVGPGEVVRQDLWAKFLAEKTTIERAQSQRRAARAEQEAVRMRRAAQRFDDAP
jgi:hypothetical protein